MAKPLLFIEDVQTAPRINLGRLDRTVVNITPLAVPARLGLPLAGALLSLLTHHDTLSISKRLGLGLAYGLGLELMNTGHSLGHWASAKAAGADMDELLITATREATLYVNNDVSPRQHIGRSLGGPVANLVMALLWFLLAGKSTVGRTLALMNLGTAFVACLPIKDVDGEVLWREVPRLLKERGNA